MRLLGQALDLGVTLFDTANVYGQGDAERAIGQAFRHHRDEVVIGTKVGLTVPARAGSIRRLKPLLHGLGRLTPARRALKALTSRRRVMPRAPQSLMDDLEASLRRLEMDHVDILYLHNPGTPDDATVGVMESALKRGLCRQIGVSITEPARAREWAGTGVLSVIQTPAGVSALGDLGTTQPAPGIATIGREVFSGGRLFDPSWLRRTIEQLEAEVRPMIDPDDPMGYLPWLASSGLVDHVIVGTTNIDHLRVAVDAMTGHTTA